VRAHHDAACWRSYMAHALGALVFIVRRRLWASFWQEGALCVLHVPAQRIEPVESAPKECRGRPITYQCA